MRDGDIGSLVFWRQDKYHVKLSPSFFLDSKWRHLEGCAENPSQRRSSTEDSLKGVSLGHFRIYILCVARAPNVS